MRPVGRQHAPYIPALKKLFVLLKNRFPSWPISSPSGSLLGLAALQVVAPAADRAGNRTSTAPQEGEKDQKETPGALVC